MRAAVATLAFVATLTLGAAGQGRSWSVDDLIQYAHLSPAEFEADALLRISQSARIDDGRRRNLLTEAFMRAYSAPEAYRRISFGVPEDSRQGAQALTYDTRLTRVSLQVRATQLMATIDPARARELFQWIEPGVEGSRCEDTLVPALGEYYNALSVLARTTFGSRIEGMRFLEFYLWRAHLPSEMPAVASAVLHFKPGHDEALYLEGVLRFILEGGTSDPRGFSVSGIDIVGKFAELEDADRAMGITGNHLLRAVRAYLKKHLAGARCIDSGTEMYAADAFNLRARKTAVGGDNVAPLDPSDVRAQRLLAAARLDLYWQSVDARRLHEDFLDLRGRDKNPVSERIRRTKEWRERAERLITDLDHWTQARDFEGDYFFQKAWLLTEVLALMPSSPARTHGIRTIVDFLRLGDGDRTRRALWFVFVNRMLELSRGTDSGIILDALEDTHHPVLELYARLERMLPVGRRATD